MTLVRVGALCSLQCFHIVGWVARRTCGPSREKKFKALVSTTENHLPFSPFLNICSNSVVSTGTDSQTQNNQEQMFKEF